MELQIKVKAELANIGLILNSVEKAVADLGNQHFLKSDLLVVVEEVVVNIVKYANASFLNIHIKSCSNWVCVIIEDDGKPFDVTLLNKKPDISSPIKDRKAGGLGLFFASELSDEFHYVRQRGINRWEIKNSFKSHKIHYLCDSSFNFRIPPHNWLWGTKDRR